jgi:hypothetical protein
MEIVGYLQAKNVGVIWGSALARYGMQNEQRLTIKNRALIQISIELPLGIRKQREIEFFLLGTEMISPDDNGTRR